MKLGYKAAAEQFGPRDLLAFAIEAEEAGFDSVFVSDHFHPFWHTGGHAPAAPPWLGAATQRTSRVVLGTSVVAPTFRQHPAGVAQAFATLACLAPGRIALGIGSGEPINELPLGLEAWPAVSERFGRLREATDIIKALWDGGFADYNGSYFRLRGARLYDLPELPPALYIAASGEKVAAFAGRSVDGVLATSARGAGFCQDVIFNSAATAAAVAGRDPASLERVVEVKVAYHPDPEKALSETRTWSALDFLHEQTGDPRVLEALAAASSMPGAGRWLLASDAEQHVEQLRPFVEAATHLVLHSPADDQIAFIRRYGREILPRLRRLTG
ncbi:MAG: TIGR03557 family F420-dependent LLM class oxidoreductase [Candidatus Dormibacteraeota bacterium]|uniref:TIGR03557 family F420-dependent LLM class oxidoreductase n=1 Tax=Candidatus Dormiibacter inghamiae TaxID=3127013 RepID=A0A934NC84_9BACT|nr:TIGR03557 family F420-dependent LLM class oxidoreductase [Candidatus Dormibacteraeota bacterium]MBJ7605281.1 TIGR03557 family F420-dependent LLM class oxidoreductase [Candidatus Dormibacteraeota bacterium]